MPHDWPILLPPRVGQLIPQPSQLPTSADLEQSADPQTHIKLEHGPLHGMGALPMTHSSGINFL